MIGDGKKLGKGLLDQPEGFDSKVDSNPEQSDGKFVRFLTKLMNSKLAKALVMVAAAAGVASCDVPDDEEDKKDPDPYTEKYDGYEDGDKMASPLYVKPGVVSSVKKNPDLNLEFPPTLRILSVSANENLIRITGAVKPGHSEKLIVRVYDVDGNEKFEGIYEVSSDNEFGTFPLLIENFSGEVGDLVDLYNKNGESIFGDPYEIE